jgi:outer membrane protein assembly factor BamA
MPPVLAAQHKAVARSASAPAAAPTRWPIERIVVEGNHHYTREQVLAVVGLKIGQIAGKAEFDAAYDRLLACGAFEKVDYRFEPGLEKQGYTATFQVTEVEPVYPLRFEELGVAGGDITAWLKEHEPLFGGSVPATAQMLDRYARQIQAFLATRQREEKVIGRVVATGPDQFAVLFRPARNSPAVAEVSFAGNQVIPTQRLQEAITRVAIGSPYNEERFRLLLDSSIRPLYDARGRIRISFPKIVAEPVKDVQGLRVGVTIDEGASYDLGAVEVDGGGAFQPAVLVKTANVKTGDMANFDDVNQGAGRVRRLFLRNGFLHAATTVERHVDDTKKVVNIVIHVQAGPQFLFGKLTIQGLDLNGEAAIRKMWTLKTGKPFDAEYPDYFLGRVREEGVFDNLKKTRAATAVDEPNHSVDVTLFFNL